MCVYYCRTYYKARLFVLNTPITSSKVVKGREEYTIETHTLHFPEQVQGPAGV